MYKGFVFDENGKIVKELEFFSLGVNFFNKVKGGFLDNFVSFFKLLFYYVNDGIFLII